MYLDCRLTRQASRFIREMQEEGLDPRYCLKCANILKRFVEHCQEQGIGSAGKVIPETLRTFMQDYHGMSVTYQRQNWSVLKRFLSSLDNPVCLKMRMRLRGTSRTRISWLSREQAERIANLPKNPREALLICGGLFQVLRRIEILRLTYRDAHDALESGLLRATAKGKTRVVSLQKDFRKVLEDYMRWLEPGFPSDRILPISRTRSEDILREWCKKHSVEPTLQFHQLRRTPLRLMWESGERTETLAKIAGHEDTKVTLLYIGANETHMRDTLDRYSLVQNRPGNA